MNGALVSRRQVALVPTALAVVALVAALAVALVGAAPAGAQDEVVIDIIDFTFDPGSVEVPVGTTVTWTNSDSAPHTATGDGGAFDTGTIEPGAAASVTFDQAGTYTYFCAIHPDMVATLVVTGGDDGGDGGESTDSGDDGGTGTTTTTVPSTGVGSAFATGGSSPLALVLLALAGALGATGLLLRRSAVR